MALFFNLELLETETECNPELMVKMLERYFRNKTIPKNYYKSKSYKNLSGHSFILNPRELFLDTCDTIYKAQYIRLAGRRDYSLYKLYKVVYLDLSYYKDINLDALKYNPLLNIHENKIYFKHEK